MKRLISSTISFLTALAMTAGAGTAGVVCAVDDTGEVSGFEVTLGDADFCSLTLPASPKAQSNYKSGSFNYGDQLDVNNTAVYNEFVKLTVPDLTPIVVDLPETVTLKVSALPNSARFTEEDQENFQLAVFGACKPGIDAALFDCPEIYWIEPSGINIALGRSDVIDQHAARIRHIGGTHAPYRTVVLQRIERVKVFGLHGSQTDWRGRFHSFGE